MSVEEYFKDVLDEISIKLDDKERELIQKKHNILREKLNEYLDIRDDFLTGSYARATLIKPKNSDDKFDVDVFVAFSNDDYGEKELEELREVTIKALKDIKDKYPELGITAINENQRRSVGLEFGSNFQIDVVPSIELEKDVNYKIFDKISLKPVKSNPKLHNEKLKEANEKSSSGTIKKLVPIIKILKSWKREKCDYLKSFHLEMLAIKILGNTSIQSFSQGIGKFFSNIEKYTQEACLKDPANEENIIDEYLDEDDNRNQLLLLIEKEKRIAERALELEKEEEEEKAIKEWIKIFGGTGVYKGKSVIIKHNPPKPWQNGINKNF